MALSQSSARAANEPHAHVADARCPWCDQVVSHEKFDEIRARIEAKERERSAEAERHLKEQVSREKAQAEAKTKAEVDLFEAIKGEFPNDEVTRVNKGAAGADIIHNVVHNGKVCGCIIYDSKNRNAWRNEYVAKLRQDQLSAKADHAILSTMVFPA